MPVLPDNVVAYRKTPVFKETSVPKGLLKDHSTAEGVWGKICLESGSLQYNITETSQECSFTLTPDTPGVIVPQQLHNVGVDGPVSFYVEFYRAICWF